MTWSHFKPAKGAGRGDGWGGPARGAGSGGPAVPFTKDSPTRHKGARDPAKMERRRVRTAEKAARNAQLLELIADLALNAAREETQLSAAIAYLNREEGMPIARNQNENRDLTLEELVKASLAPKSST